MSSQLPRSLVPLPGESLPGYLLRLAHRLDRTPARILQLTGLADGDTRFPSRISHELMIRLDRAAHEAFAHATGLDATDIDSLCLHSLTPRYPIQDPAAHGRSLIQRADWWIFSTATRYCPDCLAGDGSPIQKAHGGAWRRTWRLPVVFACTRHQRFLEHLCPICRRPAHETVAGTARIPLIPGLKAGGLHPAQCRTHTAKGNSGMTRGAISVCGTRLDRYAPATNASGTVLAFQERLVALLDPSGPETVTSAAQPTEPARYFTDLRLLTILISHSWPRARQLAPSRDLADAIDQHIALQSERERAFARQRPQTIRVSALARPLNPAAGAGLLLIADQILRLPEPAEIREALQPLLPHDWNSAYRLGWAKHFLSSARPDCSPGLLKAVIPLVRAYPRQGAKARRAPEIRTGLGPEHIPAYLPEKYFARYLRHIDGIRPDYIRRTASARLVQMIAGGSLGGAAHFLGIPSGLITGGRRTYNSHGVLKWARNRPDPGDFDAALEKIANEICGAGQLVNYKHRRDTLRTWAIDPQDWLAMLHDNQAEFNSRSPLTERERQWASVLIWAEITQGEYAFAPQPIRDHQPAKTQKKWRHRAHPERWPRDPEVSAVAPSKRYLALKHTLTAYAADLAAQIDHTAQPPDDRPGQLTLTAKATNRWPRDHSQAHFRRRWAN